MRNFKQQFSLNSIRIKSIESRSMWRARYRKHGKEEYFIYNFSEIPQRKETTRAN